MYELFISINSNAAMDKIERVRGRPSIDVRGKDLIFARDDTAVMDRNINANDNKAYGNVPVALAA